MTKESGMWTSSWLGKILLVVLIISGPLCVEAFSQGTLSGSNATTISSTDFPHSFAISAQDVLNVTYRLSDVSIGSRTTFDMSGLASEDVRMRARLGELMTQGSISFRSGSFTRAMLEVSGNWEGLSCSTAFLIADIGSSQTPSYDSGAIIRFSGVMEGLGYLSAAVGIGTTPFGQVTAGSCFEGARILISDLAFCRGKAGLDLSLGKVGLQSEVASWQTVLPFHDLRFQISLRFADLLEFQGLTASIRGSIGNLQTSGYFSFDADYAFTFGVWSLGGPLFGGNLSSAVSFGSGSLSSLTMTWTYSYDGFFLVLGPEIAIEAFDGRVLQFGIPSVRADIRWTLGCCDGPGIGDLSVFFVATRTGIGQLRITYTYAF